MKIGVAISNYGQNPSRDFLINAAKQIEESQLDSIWTSDHIIVPKESSPWTRVFESITTLGFLASITKKVLLGTSIIILPLRNPLVLAKQIATLDSLSGGRVMLGMGIGWNKPEFDLLQKDFESRTKIIGEYIEKMKKLWRADYINQGYVSEPLPVSKNGPPILIGGQSAAALKRVAELGDGWHPVGISPQQYESGKNKIVQMSSRDYIWSLRIGFAANKKIDSQYVGTDGGPRLRLVGDVSQITSAISQYEKIGVNHLICDIRDSGDEYIEQIKILGQIKKNFD